MVQHKQLKYRYFFFSFAVAFFVLAVMILFLVTTVRPKIPQSTAPTGQALPVAYSPQPEDSLSLLFIGTPSADAPASTFVVARFLPERQMIPFTVLPPELLLQNNGKAESLSDIYQYGGAVYTRDVLNQNLGITLDRYIRMDASGFSEAVKIVGGMEFDLPKAMAYTDAAGLAVSLRPGFQKLDGPRMLGLLAPENYSNGISRSQMAGELAQALINQRLDVVLSTMADDIFTAIINLSDSDISFQDYEKRRAAGVFMARLPEKPAQFLPVHTLATQEGYTLSDTFVVRLQQAFLG